MLFGRWRMVRIMILIGLPARCLTGRCRTNIRRLLGENGRLFSCLWSRGGSAMSYKLGRCINSLLKLSSLKASNSNVIPLFLFVSMRCIDDVMIMKKVTKP
ncbi:hypothetical protein EV363DRAFT_713409 [Boletus edulis]|nr:hypothetical protein EV363DRAFT_713409 [Boletus edulis]